ncbi:MAG: pyrimidine reductase family protein [Pseudonocardiales bacterium]|nr:MAG: pyrimidine reductase family protein [Pseudonocardiales bacterium]
MRALVPSPVDDVDLHAFYGADWLDGGGLRVNFVVSVDGAATQGGASRGLQTRGDNRIFAALRDLADVVVAGAGTVRTEGYSAIELSARRRAIRAEYGLPAQLPTAVVSRSLRLDPAATLFTAASGTARTIVITCAAGDSIVRAELEQVAEVVVCGGDTVDLPAARAALAERGLTRVLCEGGPTLFADLAQAGVVDELCLSISPLLSGPGARRAVAGQPWHDAPRALTLAGLLEEDGALFCRYRVSH